VDLSPEQLEELFRRLERIEAALGVLVQRQAVKDFYTTDEFAKLVGKAEFTVREWCRHGRVRGKKRLSGRGASPAWVISHEELLRYQKEGLLPLAAGQGGGTPGRSQFRHAPTGFSGPSPLAGAEEP
jgi:hypothetical protein